MSLELFHRIADADSAQVRRYVSEQGLAERVRFRNLHYPEAEADFIARGGRRPPALWDGACLAHGASAVIGRLRELAAADFRSG